MNNKKDCAPRLDNSRAESRKRLIRAMFSRKIVIVATVIVVLFILAALFAPALAPYDPNAADLYDISSPPSAKHLLGTDASGRDVLSRLLYGSRISITIGLVAVSIACIIGTLLGMCAAYFGGIIDTVIMRTMEALRSVPSVILAMALVTIYGGGFRNVAIILGVSTVPGYVMMMRAQVLSVKSADYVTAARLQGNSSIRLMMHHILPNCVSPLIVMMTQQVGSTILSEAGLSFIGVGISVPTASWGTMVSQGKDVLLQNPLLALLPGLCVALLVICLNTMGDGIRDALDPRLRGEI